MIENDDCSWMNYGHTFMPLDIYRELTSGSEWMLIMTPVCLINDIDILKGMLAKFDKFGGLEIE